jgi:hypothetical protein
MLREESASDAARNKKSRPNITMLKHGTDLRSSSVNPCEEPWCSIAGAAWIWRSSGLLAWGVLGARRWRPILNSDWSLLVLIDPTLRATTVYMDQYSARIRKALSVLSKTPVNSSGSWGQTRILKLPRTATISLAPQNISTSAFS